MVPVKDISVIICTRNRASSLKVTLECLCLNDRDGLNVEIIIVDNNSSDETRETTEAFRDCLPVRYLFEPTLGTYGKSHALNCALDAGGLGELVAVIDDDISPHQDWLKGVASISARWPDKDLFTGRTTIIWPFDTIPRWALRPAIRGWIFSAADFGDRDRHLHEGRWFSGNHFWFRSRVLSARRRFKDIWLTEPDFMLQLAEEGYEGIAGPEAVVGHRVQPRLLTETVARQLAEQVGRSYAALRLKPYRSKIKQAFLFRKYPLWARLFCLANGFRWRCLYLLSQLYGSCDERFVRSLVARERYTTYQELLRVASQMEEYRIIRKR